MMSSYLSYAKGCPLGYKPRYKFIPFTFGCVELQGHTGTHLQGITRLPCQSTV
jgi:hypothetical protein